MNADASANARQDDDREDPRDRKSSGLFHEPPRPLFREMPRAAEFPIGALPKELANPIAGIVDIVQCAPSIAAHGVLGASTLAAQTFADVELPTGSIKPLTEFFMSVASSGERKTTSNTQAYGGIREHEKHRREQYDFEMEGYENDHDAWEHARHNAKQKCKGDRAAIKAALEAVGAEPKQPISPMMMTENPTIEGLIKNAGHLSPSMGIVTSEGGQFTGGYGFSDEAMTRTATAMSCFWDGETVRRIRAGDGVSMVDGRRLMVDIQCQPQIALAFFGNEILRDQGLISRFLSTWPDSNVGGRIFRPPSAAALNDVATFRRTIASLLGRPWPMLDGGSGGLAPRVLKMSGPARDLWAKFSNECESRQAEGGAFSGIRPFASKLAEHAARLAGVITIVKDPEAYTLDIDAIGAGVKLASFYASEHLRITEAGRVNPDLQLAAKVWDWLSLTWKHAAVSLPDVYQRGPVTAIREKSRASQIIGILEDHGYLAKLGKGAMIGDQKRRLAWAVWGRHP